MKLQPTGIHTASVQSTIPKLQMVDRTFLYYMPETQGHRNYKCTPENFLLSLEVAEETCCTRECVWSCSPEFKELASMIMVEEDLVLPRNAADAEHLYIRLLSSIELSRNA